MPQMSKENRVSAISSIKRSGFELVQKRKSSGKRATMSDYAKINFEPWVRDPDMHPNALIPADDVLTNCGVPARLAYATMLQTKEHLAGMFDKIEIECIDNMIASYAEAAETLKAITFILEAAYTRVLVAGAYHQIRESRAQGLAKRRRTLAKRRRG
jgi:hypothetical protein